jgi:3',5'-cyclic AMP phosphodiesterase CpdA
MSRTPKTAASSTGSTRDSPDDWLIIAGDVGEIFAEVEEALRTLRGGFRRVNWTPGNSPARFAGLPRPQRKELNCWTTRQAEGFLRHCHRIDDRWPTCSSS